MKSFVMGSAGALAMVVLLIGVAVAADIFSVDRNGVVRFGISDTGAARLTAADNANPALNVTQSGTAPVAVFSGGKVGIGTTNPSSILDARGYIISQGDSTGIANTGYLSFRDGAGTELGWVGDGSSTTNDMYFYSAGNLILLNGGGNKVGIGTGAPDQLLSVAGNASKAGGGSWATFSDERLKNISGEFSAGLDEVMKLNPVRYRYKKENALGIPDEGEHVGFSAQEVEKVIPDAVSTNSKGYRMVENDPILWAMLNAIKEQQREIEELKERLNGGGK